MTVVLIRFVKQKLDIIVFAAPLLVFNVVFADLIQKIVAVFGRRISFLNNIDEYLNHTELPQQRLPLIGIDFQKIHEVRNPHSRRHSLNTDNLFNLPFLSFNNLKSVQQLIFP